MIGRTVGKVFGSYVGTSIVKSSPNVKIYLGATLLTQSGVAIGLSIAAYNAISPLNMEFALTIQNVVLAAVLVFELFAPLLVKMAFEKSGESQDYNDKKEIEKEKVRKRKLAHSH